MITSNSVRGGRRLDRAPHRAGLGLRLRRDVDGPARRDPRRDAGVAIPGCYPTGFIGLVRPLVAAGLVPADFPLTVNAISGYSGGGKGLIAEFEDQAAPAGTERRLPRSMA